MREEIQDIAVGTHGPSAVYQTEADYINLISISRRY